MMSQRCVKSSTAAISSLWGASRASTTRSKALSTCHHAVFSTAARRRLPVDALNFSSPAMSSLCRTPVRLLSTTADPSVTTGTSTTTDASKATTAVKDDSNLFLDNLGKIFLTAIGLIIAALMRSHYGTKDRTALRDQIEEQASLDPMEIDDLRVANSELSVDVFRTIMKDVAQAFLSSSSSDEIPYEDFVMVVRRTMQGLKGDAFTVQLSHYLDRAVVGALQHHNKSSQDGMPIEFWLTVLSLALPSPVPDRIQVLYEVLSLKNDKVTVDDVITMVGYLQDTCQLVPDAQIVTTETKYPIQKHVTGTPSQLVPWTGSTQEEVDINAFADILRSKSVCAWGECYHKKKQAPA